MRAGLSNANAVISRLSSFRALTPEEAVVVQAGSQGRPHRARTILLNDGDEAPVSRFLLSGWAARVRELNDGRRQFLSIFIPGDAIGLYTGPHLVADTRVVALTEGYTMSGQTVRSALAAPTRYPALAYAVEAAAIEEQAFLRNSVLRTGRQSAYERLAHFILEAQYRTANAGLGAGPTFPLPLTQEMLGDHLALSIVHVNRTLQVLRREQTVTFAGGGVTILDYDRLHRAAEFTPPRITAAQSAPARRE